MVLENVNSNVSNCTLLERYTSTKKETVYGYDVRVTNEQQLLSTLTEVGILILCITILASYL